MKKGKTSSIHIWGVALILVAIVLGNVVSIVLYNWEAHSRALAFAESPENLEAPALAELPSAKQVPLATPQEAQPEAKATVAEAKAPPGEANAEAPAIVASSISFQKDILPIFQKSCNMCHGNLGGLNLANYSSLMTTGNHLPQVNPGKPETSLLVKRLAEKPLMPPMGSLPAAEIERIKQWIQEGAVDN